MVAAAVEKYGRIDVAVNNAALPPTGPSSTSSTSSTGTA